MYDEIVMKLLAQTEKARPRAELEELMGIISREEADIYISLPNEYQNGRSAERVWQYL